MSANRPETHPDCPCRWAARPPSPEEGRRATFASFAAMLLCFSIPMIMLILDGTNKLFPSFKLQLSTDQAAVLVAVIIGGLFLYILCPGLQAIIHRTPKRANRSPEP